MERSQQSLEQRVSWATFWVSLAHFHYDEFGKYSYRNSQQDATMYHNLLFHVYMKLNMFWATHSPSSGAQNCTSGLWFCIRERLFGRWCCWTLTASSNLNVQTTFHVCKTRGCQCSFELLMMGGVSPETCWASYKHGIMNYDKLLRLVGYFCMSYAMMHASTNIKFGKYYFDNLVFYFNLPLQIWVYLHEWYFTFLHVCWDILFSK